MEMASDNQVSGYLRTWLYAGQERGNDTEKHAKQPKRSVAKDAHLWSQDADVEEG